MPTLPLFLGIMLTSTTLPNPNILRAQVWILTDNPRISLKFGDNQMVSGSGGCNRFTGRYRLTGTQLQIGPLASTKMACAEEIMEQESKFCQALDTAQQARWDSQSLVITTKTGTLQFRPPINPCT
jgi:heat shock protein HslJ